LFGNDSFWAEEFLDVPETSSKLKFYDNGPAIGQAPRGLLSNPNATETRRMGCHERQYQSKAKSPIRINYLIQLSICSKNH
jgi:hypothetical protein